MCLGRAPGRDGSLLKVPLTERSQALAAERAGTGKLHPRGRERSVNVTLIRLPSRPGARPRSKPKPPQALPARRSKVSKTSKASKP